MGGGGGRVSAQRVITTEVVPTELTWANKALRLATGHDGQHRWLGPSDPHEPEPLPLCVLGTFGDPQTAHENLLIEADAQHALSTLLSADERSSRCPTKVRLCYL